MNLTLSLNKELEVLVNQHPYIKWTEIARQAIREEAIKLKKSELLQKYVRQEAFSDDDEAFMERVDWRPVDEFPLREEFAASLVKAAKTKGRSISSLAELE